MRAGGYSMHQALTSDAAAVVKQAVVLAKRRGHTQVTPLHVASTMMASSGGLFRIACQELHSQAFRCKTLELCFNVALNRLPASLPNPILGPRNSQSTPSISNALIAAFKRAQAHHRRGSIENKAQPPPTLSVKIELEQLIVSILDDPSVSRVMREAGFSSTQVKSNVEKTVSLELSSSPNNKLPKEFSEKPVENNSEPINEEGSSLASESDGSAKEVELSCCSDCSANYEAEARNLQTISSLPCWLKDECKRRCGSNSTDQNCESVRDLRNKWNSFCYLAHKSGDQNEQEPLDLNI